MSLAIETSEIEAIQAGSFQGFAGVMESVYRPAPYYSQSFMTEVKRSPAHAQASKAHPKEPTPLMLMGTRAHMAILEREAFDALFIVGPDVARNTKEWKAFAAANQGKEILKPDEYETLIRMAEAVDRHPVASKLLSGGKPEHSAFWVDPATGLRFKARFDYLKSDSGIISDLKTVTDASRQAFERSCVDRGYHRQSALYLDGFNLLSGGSTDFFPHILVEREPPYAVAVYLLDNGALDKGRHEIADLKEIILRCERENHWPGYPSEIQAATLPAWAW